MLKAISYTVLIISALLFQTSCQNHASTTRVLPKDSTYFSIIQFEADQIKMYAGAPLSLYRIEHLNDETDSTIVNFMNMDWGFIFRMFSATDISDAKYVGHYDFNAFDDETTGSRIYTYTANDDKQFTRLFQIYSDPSNNRITSIYIETAKDDFMSSTKQKLLYVPLRVIQIQESVHKLIGSARNLRIDYRFMQEDEVEQE